MHGSGGRKRVREGRRKPAGRPVIHGRYSDPDRKRYDNLDELIQRFREDPNLMFATDELALLKAALHRQVEEIKAGTFSVMKSDNLPADPMSWLIENAGAVIDRIVRVNCMLNRHRFQAIMAVLEPATKVFQKIFVEYIPAEQQDDANQKVVDGIRQIVWPRDMCSPPTSW